MIKTANIKSFFRKAIHYGLTLPTTNIILTHFQGLLPKKSRQSLANWRHRVIHKKIERIIPFNVPLVYTQEDSAVTELDNNVIWTCWFQGEDAMPPIMKLCLKSIRKFSRNHRVIFLTNENLDQYVKLPEFIKEKFKSGRISFTHFSDILRTSVIRQHGGAWIDTTLLLTAPISEDFFKPTFHSIKTPEFGFFVSKCRWTGFCFSSPKNGEIISKVNDDLLRWWEKEDQVLDYFLLDYLFDRVCKNRSDLNQEIENIPISNENLSNLNRKLEEQLDIQMIENYFANTNIFKLSWKNHSDSLYKDINNNYHYISQFIEKAK